MIEAFQRLSLTSTQYYTQLSSDQFSQRLIECPRFKRLDSVLITNFKSFKGKVYVGPLLDFTSIVGPNGAGKSNVLDALMFCFCNEKSKLTFFDIREFINREGKETYSEMLDKNKYAEVEVKFLLANDRYFTISRTLYPDEKQVFVLDGDEYPQKVYENFLIKNNINCITANYAIWQGQVDKMLLKNPKELTNYIETVSGSIFFRKEQDDLAEQIKTVDEYLNARSLKVAKLKQEKKHMKNFNNQKNVNLKIQNEYENLLKQLVLAKSLLSELQIKQFERSIDETEKEQQQRIKKINITKAQLQKEQADRIKYQVKVNVLMKQIAQNTAKLRAIGQLSNVIDIQTIEDLTKEVDSLKRYWDNLNYRKSQIEKEVHSLPSSDENKEYLELYSRWEKENEAINKELTKRKEQYLYTQSILKSKKNIMEDYIQKQTKKQQMVRQQILQQKAIQEHISQLDKAISQKKIQHSRMAEEFSKSIRTVDGLQEKIRSANQKIIDLQTIINQSLQNEKDKQIVLKLNSIDGFRGLVQQWLKPSNKKYQLCFSMLLGPILRYLLCIDEASSKQITVKLREHYQIRNLVILNNVHQKKELVPRSILGKLGFPAIDAISYDKKIHNFDIFLKEYLNGKVICEDLRAAWTLLGQDIRGIKEIYTLDGNVLKHDGVVSSQGSVDYAKNKYKYSDVSKNSSSIMQEIQALNRQKSNYAEKLDKLKKQSSQDLLLKHTLDIQRLEAKKEELSLKLSLLMKAIDSKKDSKTPKGIEKDIQELEKRSKHLREGVTEIEKQMLKSNIFTDFLKRHKIEGLDNFRQMQDLSSLESMMRNKNRLTKELQQTEREIAKITTQLTIKEDRLHKLREKIDSIKGFSERQGLEKLIKSKEGELYEVRGEMAKMKNINPESLKFKSQVIQMRAKLQIMKDRHFKEIKAQADSLGLMELPSMADYHVLEPLLGIKIERANSERVAMLEEELLKEKKDLEQELQRNNVGLGGLRSQFQNQEKLEQQIHRLTDQLKEATENKNNLLQKLNKVKEDRKAVFMNFMNDLKPILQTAYETLTERENGSGRVDIFMENEAFPCDEGLYYTPVPPTKRFVYDLDQLSGGEKSIASLALQYAISIASKASFLILDQTDAFLDSENTKRFSNLIKKTLSERKLQFVLITHKRNLFLSGESLVGVTKFKDNPFSKAYSLRLNEPQFQRANS